MSLSSASPSNSLGAGSKNSSSPQVNNLSFELPDPPTAASLLGGVMHSPSLAAAPNTSTDDDANTTNATNTNPLDLLMKTPADPVDDAFAQMMRERTKQRKEREDTALAHLRVQVRRLEAALAAETKRRVQSVQKAQEEAVDAVAQVSEQWRTLYQTEQAATQERMRLLEERVQQLEQKWKKDVVALQTTVHKSAEKCNETMNELKEQMQVDNQSRLQREDQLSQQLQTIQDEYAARWKSERQDRVQALHALQQRVQTQESVRDGQVQALESRMQEELDHVSAALKVEVQERHEQDAAIVAVVNKYTAQVQASLSFVSGV